MPGPDPTQFTATWRLNVPPIASIGSVEGDEADQLVRVNAAWKQSDGHIVVVDGPRSVIAFYDSLGRYLYGTGRRGAGPGEFESRVYAWPYRGDSIALFDYMLLRVTVFDPEGRFTRSFPNPIRYERTAGMMPAEACCSITGSLADGTFVGHPPDQIPVGPGPPRFGMASLYRVSASGAEATRLGVFESRLYSYDPSAPSGVGHYAGSYSFRYTVVGDTLFGSNGATTAVLAMRDPFARVDTIALPGDPVAFTPELQAEYEHAIREDYALRGNRAYEGTLESNLPRQYAPALPRFTNLRSSSDGRLWLQRWTPHTGRQDAPVEFAIHTTDGRHLANIELPGGSRLLWAGRNQIMLLERDSLDVQYVRLYAIAMPEGG